MNSETTKFHFSATRIEQTVRKFLTRAEQIFDFGLTKSGRKKGWYELNGFFSSLSSRSKKSWWEKIRCELNGSSAPSAPVQKRAVKKTRRERNGSKERGKLVYFSLSIFDSEMTVTTEFWSAQLIHLIEWSDCVWKSLNKSRWTEQLFQRIGSLCWAKQLGFALQNELICTSLILQRVKK